MHLFANFVLEDLETARNELTTSFEKLDTEKWKLKTPGGEHDVHALANHILSDSQRLAILAPIVDIDDLFPSPTNEDQYSCVWKNERATLSPENILAKGRYERNKLRTLLTLIRDHKQARKLCESDFQTGWHERMHLFDLQQALTINFTSQFQTPPVILAIRQLTERPESPTSIRDAGSSTSMTMKNVERAQVFVDAFKDVTNVLPILYDIDTRKIDEISQTNQTYHQEIKMLVQGKFVDAIHRWLGISDHMQRLKGSASIEQQIYRIHVLRNDMMTHMRKLEDEQLAIMIDGKPLVKRLQRLSLDFQTKTLLFKKINLRYAWAREARL